MPKRKQTRSRKASSGRPPLERLRDSWSATRAALMTAERTMEKQVRGLLKRHRLSAREAGLILKGLRARAERERRKALESLEKSRLTLQSRLKRERKALLRLMGEAVQSALAALNIPSRQEIAELTRRVEALSRRLDARKR